MTETGANRKFITFIAIWLGEVVSVFGSGLTGFALGVWVYQQTGSATQFALISMFAVLPSIVASPFAGALVDRWDRRWVLLLSNLLSALVTLSLAGLFFAGRLETWHIYLGTIVNSLSGSLFQPALQASVTMLVDRKHYGRANGMIQLGFGAAQIASPVLAGILVVAIQIWRVLMIDFATFLVAIVVLLIVRIPRPQATAAGKRAPNLLGEASYGWRYVLARPGLLGLLIFFAILNFALGIVEVLITPLVLSFADAAVLGRVLSTAGIGLLLGGLVMSVWGGPKRRVLGILFFSLMQALILFLGGLRPNAVLVAIAAIVFLFNSQIIAASSQTIWQSKVEPDVQGRVFSVRMMIGWSTLPLAYLVAGPLADYVFNPLLMSGGGLSGSIGQIIGVGPGRGIGLLYILLGVMLLATVLGAYLYTPLRRVESDLPDAVVEHEPPATTPDRAPEAGDQAQLPVA